VVERKYLDLLARVQAENAELAAAAGRLA